MPTYVSLINWTEQGIQGVKDTVERASAARGAAESMGGSVKEILWTVGPYDLVVISDFPDDETGTAYLLALGAQGNIRTTTLRAFNEQEMAGVIGRVP